ncbi:MAG: hypothetical protein M3R53_06455 [Candidatus Eremiobacteraeota bacterium]|nr:hypothetical protein [Candidatus Eremiobacteraeota bacterium]
MNRGALALAVIAALGVVGDRSALAIEGTYEATTTRIPVKLTERLSSQDLKVGDTFGFDTTSSALVDGVFLPARTHGHGVVLAVRSGHGPQPGVLKVVARTLDAPGGDAIPVALEAGALDEELKGDYRTAPGGASIGAVRLGTLRTTNIVYEKGTPFIVVAPPPPGSQASPGT